ncbi:MAG: hypothetical protein COS57_06640 [Syntrophobacterales bacterium CG03_land_8_20_14_0_80_58_14]|nr:MAG: hypothetical protein COS57_06640 [Syntrophobacterales bacterium CG03_land_8_20_14_0_80_58_14]
MKHIDRIGGLERTSHLPTVAQPAALLAERRTRFMCRKRTYSGFTNRHRPNRLSMVGIGPDGPQNFSFLLPSP